MTSTLLPYYGFFKEHFNTKSEKKTKVYDSESITKPAIYC